MKDKLYFKMIFSACLSVLCTFSLAGQNAVMVQDPAGFDVAADTPVLDESVPVALEGIWENSQRYVIFDSGYVEKLSKQVIPTIALKNFYGYYVDRAAESDEFTLNHTRNRDDSTSRSAQQLQIHFEPLVYELYPEETGIGYDYGDGITLYSGSEISGAWDMQVKYPGFKETYHIPICVIGNKIFLNFKIRYEIPENSADSESDITGFWQDQGWASGITVSPPYMNTELLSYYVTDTDCFHIRYWETEMEYDGETQASFTVGDGSYSVPKHLVSASRIFTCVNGRSRKIRNIERTASIPEEYTLNSVIAVRTYTDADGSVRTQRQSTATIIALGEPYLELVEGSRTFKEILEEAARRKKPGDVPLFPPHGLLDFDWSIIEDPPSSYNRRMLDLGK